MRVTRTGGPAPHHGVPRAGDTSGGHGIGWPGWCAPLWGPGVARGSPGSWLGRRVRGTQRPTVGKRGLGHHRERGRRERPLGGGAHGQAWRGAVGQRVGRDRRWWLLIFCDRRRRLGARERWGRRAGRRGVPSQLQGGPGLPHRILELLHAHPAQMGQRPHGGEVLQKRVQGHLALQELLSHGLEDISSSGNRGLPGSRPPEYPQVRGQLRPSHPSQAQELPVFSGPPPRFGNFSLWPFSLLIYYTSACLFTLSPSPGHQLPEGGDHLSWPPPPPPRHRARLTAAAARSVDWPHEHWPPGH